MKINLNDEQKALLRGLLERTTLSAAQAAHRSLVRRLVRLTDKFSANQYVVDLSVDEREFIKSLIDDGLKTSLPKSLETVEASDRTEEQKELARERVKVTIEQLTAVSGLL